MKTKALRLYGKNDLRLEEFELPKLREDEILARVVTDSICMSTYKMVIQGEDHRRVPKGINTNPIMSSAGKYWKLGQNGELNTSSTASSPFRPP
jgi:threonine dehydrogenase-like Zn-dependent dehydrogenase